jgi:hypothetical protein
MPANARDKEHPNSKKGAIQLELKNIAFPRLSILGLGLGSRRICTSKQKPITQTDIEPENKAMTPSILLERKSCMTHLPEKSKWLRYSGHCKSNTPDESLIRKHSRYPMIA